MKIIQLTCQKSSTERRLDELFPNVGSKKKKYIDQSVKKLIANGKTNEEIFDYIMREMPQGQSIRGKFRDKCKSLAEKYVENNYRWMCQENLFCFLALVVSVILLFLNSGGSD